MSDGRSTGVRCPQIDPSADPKFRVHGTPTDPTYLICSCILSRRQESESADQQSHEIDSNAPASFANWSDTASDGNLEGELIPVTALAPAGENPDPNALGHGARSG